MKVRSREKQDDIKSLKRREEDKKKSTHHLADNLAIRKSESKISDFRLKQLANKV